MKSRIVPTLILVAVVTVGGWLGWNLWFPDQPDTDAEEQSAAASDGEHVELTPQKLAAAGIEVIPAAQRELRETRVVPGRLRYDDTRHIEIKIPTSGILTEVRVKPGDVVAADDVLAVLNSPEVGHARADVLQRAAEFDIAKQAFEWEEATCQGLERLLAAIEAGGDAREVSQKLAGVTLGEHRGEIMTAYTRFQLAQVLARNLEGVSESGALPGRTVQERLSERNAAEAALKGASEQSLFEARQECAAARLKKEDAQRRLDIARQNLETLLGYADRPAAEYEQTPLSSVEVRAPFGGTIEAKHFSASERVAEGNALFVLADTSRLWVAADIRDREWAALTLAPQAQVDVTFPALPGQVLQAEVYYIGREVSPDTNAIPLIATIDNADGRLRPGQFVRVALPVGEARDVVAVSDAAVVEHDGQAFVFRKVSEQQYRRIDVRTGLTDRGWTEIVSGLEAGVPVVSRGAFFLKSELLLEGEEE